MIRAELALQVKLVEESQHLDRLVQPLLPGLLMAEIYIRCTSCTTFLWNFMCLFLIKHALQPFRKILPQTRGSAVQAGDHGQPNQGAVRRQYACAAAAAVRCARVS